MIAFLFPGQGSQRHKMGEGWLNESSKDISLEISDYFQTDINSLLLSTPEQELKLTENAQIATFSMSMIILDCILRLGISADYSAGHSLGEYSALCESGALALDQVCALIKVRSQLMSKVCRDNPGSMAAVIGIDSHEIAIIKSKLEGEVYIANENSPDQTVIGGSEQAIQELSVIVKSLGGKVLPLKVSGAFHTPFMQPIKPQLDEVISSQEFRTPEHPIFMNCDGRPSSDPLEIKANLMRQLTSPVRWVDTVINMANSNVTLFIEVGPGSVLTNLAKRILRTIDAHYISVSKPEDIDKLIDLLVGHKGIYDREKAVGEPLHVKDRLVLSPRPGIFVPEEKLLNYSSSKQIAVGELIGHVGKTPAYSLFQGIVKQILVLPNEPVKKGQPLIWIVSE